MARFGLTLFGFVHSMAIGVLVRILHLQGACIGFHCYLAVALRINGSYDASESFKNVIVKTCLCLYCKTIGFVSIFMCIKCCS
jgi:hypothetical protein